MKDPTHFCIFCTQALVRQADYQGSKYYDYSCTVCLSPWKESRYTIVVRKPEDDIIVQEIVFPSNCLKGFIFSYFRKKTYLITKYQNQTSSGETVQEIPNFSMTKTQMANLTEEKIRVYLTFS